MEYKVDILRVLDGDTVDVLFNFPFDFFIYKTSNQVKNELFIRIFPTLQKSAKSDKNFKNYRPKCKDCQDFMTRL